MYPWKSLPVAGDRGGCDELLEEGVGVEFELGDDWRGEIDKRLTMPSVLSFISVLISQEGVGSAYSSRGAPTGLPGLKHEDIFPSLNELPSSKGTGYSASDDYNRG